MSSAPEPRPLDLERPAFVSHIARLQQRITELEAELASRPQPREVETGPELIEAPTVPRRRLVFNHSVHRAGSALGGLSFDQALNAHRPGVTTQDVATAAGVTCPSVSRWRIANGLVSVWVLPGEMPECWRPND